MAEEHIELVIDIAELRKACEEGNREVEALKTNAENVVNTVSKSTRSSFNQVLSMARAAYTIGLGIVKASGVSVSYFFRSMISAAFGAISILAPLISAEAVTPGMQVQAALGLAELGIAIAAVIQAQAEQSRVARDLRGAAMSLGGLQTLLGMIPDW